MTKENPILLEYSEAQQCIHYNFIADDGTPADIPNSNTYCTIAETTAEEASRFLDDIRFNDKKKPRVNWLRQAWTDWKKYN